MRALLPVVAISIAELACTKIVDEPGTTSNLRVIVSFGEDTTPTDGIATVVFYPDGGAAPCSTTDTAAPNLWNGRTFAKTPKGVFGLSSVLALEHRDSQSLALKRQGLSTPVRGSDGGLVAFVNLSPVQAIGTMKPLKNRRHAAKAIFVDATGGILVVGGLKTAGSEFAVHDAGTFEATIEYFDPSVGDWVVVSDAGSRIHHTLTQLPDGRIVVLGGIVENSPVTTALIFIPETRTVTAHALTEAAVFGHSASLVTEGNPVTQTARIVLFGGATSFVDAGADAGAGVLPVGGLSKTVAIVDFSAVAPTVRASVPSQVVGGVAFHRAAQITITTDPAIYWVGGVTGTPARATNSLYEYKTNGDGGVTLSAVLSKRVFHTITVRKDEADSPEMLVVGGMDETGTGVKTIETIGYSPGAAQPCCVITAAGSGSSRIGHAAEFVEKGVAFADKGKSVGRLLALVGGRRADGGSSLVSATRIETIATGGSSVAPADASVDAPGAAVVATPWGLAMVGGLDSASNVLSRVYTYAEAVDYDAGACK